MLPRNAAMLLDHARACRYRTRCVSDQRRWQSAIAEHPEALDEVAQRLSYALLTDTDRYALWRLADNPGHLDELPAPSGIRQSPLLLASRAFSKKIAFVVAAEKLVKGNIPDIGETTDMKVAKFGLKYSHKESSTTATSRSVEINYTVGFDISADSRATE